MLTEPEKKDPKIITLRELIKLGVQDLHKLVEEEGAVFLAVKGKTPLKITKSSLG